MNLPHRVKNLQDVVDWRLCIGCGACAYASPPGKIELVNLPTVGIRPRIQDPGYSGSECLSFCPGVGVSVPSDSAKSKTAAEKEFGAAIEIWVGYAADPEIRFRASSGGILTALALFCLEQGGMGSVLHTGKDEERPWLNETVQSRSRQQLLDRAGSRYAPSSPCDGLAQVENSDLPCVFIGKPCDVAAVASLRKMRPALDRNLGLVLTFFCAGTPSTQGTFDLVAGSSTSSHLIDIRYRGEGWPGEFKARWEDGSEKSLSYEQSWSRLTSYRPLRCNLCPDGLGQLADISCGDAWDEYDPQRPSPGVSIVLVRTPRGQRILRQAIEAGYLILQPAGPERVLVAQKNLLGRRHELFGRLLGLRLLGIPAPRYSGFSLFSAWMGLPLRRKFRTVAGTVRRALLRLWWTRTPASNKELPEGVGIMWRRGVDRTGEAIPVAAGDTHAPHVSGRGSMRRSAFGQLLFAIYRWHRFRRLSTSLSLCLEGGQFYSLTLRQILIYYHGVEVGAYSYGECMEPGSWPRGVTVGRYVSVAKGVRVFLRNHPLDRLSLHPFFYNSRLGWVPEDNIPSGQLEIGHDAWLGAGSIITTKCNRIGIGAVIGAGAVVTRDVPDFAIVAGNPAHILRYRFPEDVRQRVLESRWWERSIEECADSLDAMTRPFESVSVLASTEHSSN